MPAVGLIRLAALMVKMLFLPFWLIARGIAVASARRQQADLIGRAVARHAHPSLIRVTVPIPPRRGTFEPELPPPPSR
jgi:hypothetical protein